MKKYLILLLFIFTNCNVYKYTLIKGTYSNVKIVLPVDKNKKPNVHIVSYYGERFHNKITANREVYNMYKFTCAATKDYKFGQKLKVTNLKNNKSVIVRVNDRGNFKRLGRTLDLSKASFAAIGNLKKGLLKVKIEIIT